jgi:elongation factor Tu
MDTYFEMPERELNKPFLMPIEDIFSIEGRGTVVTGRIERGRSKSEMKLKSSVSRIRQRQRSPVLKCSTSSFRKARQATTQVFFFAERRKKTCIAVRSSAKSGSVTPHTDFESEVYILSKDEGGRHTPFFTGYKPQFYIRTTDVTGRSDSSRRKGNGYARRHGHLQGEAHRSGCS